MMRAHAQVSAFDSREIALRASRAAKIEIISPAGESNIDHRRWSQFFVPSGRARGQQYSLVRVACRRPKIRLPAVSDL